MATINCPHCGKEMYDMLDTCPHCGGPVVSEALKEETIKNVAEICARANQKEKLWLLISVIVGVVGGCWMMTYSTGEGGPGIAGPLLAGIGFMWIVYGGHYFHVYRRVANKGFSVGIILFLILIPFILMGCAFLGVYAVSKSLLRLITRQPLLSESEVMKLINEKFLYIIAFLKKTF